MSYQPRRVADFADDPVAVDELPASQSDAPRRVANSLTDKLFHRGGAIAAVVTVVATAAAVTVAATGGAAAAVAPTAAQTVAAQPLLADTLSSSQSMSLATKSAAAPIGVTQLTTQGSLNVRSDPDQTSKLLGKLALSTQVQATSEIDGDYRQIVYRGQYAWVLSDQLDDSDEPAVPSGTSMAPCSRGSAVENKLRKATIFIYRSVCPLFPDVNSYGGWRAGGMQFHKNGRALDIMLTPHKESALGHRIANYLISHAREFKIDHIIFEQHIWTPGNPHWRKMADRGSINANHFNHVHVAVVASAA